MTQITTDSIESAVAPRHWWRALRNSAIAAVALVGVALVFSFLLLLPVAQAQTKTGGELRIGYQKSASHDLKLIPKPIVVREAAWKPAR